MLIFLKAAATNINLLLCISSRIVHLRGDINLTSLLNSCTDTVAIGMTMIGLIAQVLQLRPSAVVLLFLAARAPLCRPKYAWSLSAVEET
jgi:hypothetical protein